jgi:hypothetical protein
MHGMSTSSAALLASQWGRFFRDKGETMIHRFMGTSTRLVQQASQPITWFSVIKTARGIFTTAKHTMTVFGFSAVAMMALLYFRPDLAKKVSDFLSPQQAAAVVATAPVQPKVAARPKLSRSPTTRRPRRVRRASRST